MTLPPEKNYTIEDIYALPEGQRAELFDGQMLLRICFHKILKNTKMELSSIFCVMVVLLLSFFNCNG